MTSREAEQEQAVAWAQQEKLPALKGTPKQIAWAEVLRHQILGTELARSKIDALTDRADRNPAERHLRVLADFFRSSVAQMRVHTSAHRWINDAPVEDVVLNAPLLDHVGPDLVLPQYLVRRPRRRRRFVKDYRLSSP